MFVARFMDVGRKGKIGKHIGKDKNPWIGGLSCLCLSTLYPGCISLRRSEHILGTVVRQAFGSQSASSRSHWLGKSSAPFGGSAWWAAQAVPFYLESLKLAGRRQQAKQAGRQGSKQLIICNKITPFKTRSLILLAGLCVFLVNHTCRTLSIVFKD